MTSGDETDAQCGTSTGRILVDLSPNTIYLENSVLEPAGRMTESNVNTVTVTQISLLHRVSSIVLLATIVVVAMYIENCSGKAYTCSYNSLVTFSLWDQPNVTVFYFSELCFTFPTDFTKGRCPLDPRHGDHSYVVITPRP